MGNYGQDLLSHFHQVLYDLCLYYAQISGDRLQDHWSSGFMYEPQLVACKVQATGRGEKDSLYNAHIRTAFRCEFLIYVYKTNNVGFV